MSQLSYLDARIRALEERTPTNIVARFTSRTGLTEWQLDHYGNDITEARTVLDNLKAGDLVLFHFNGQNTVNDEIQYARFHSLSYSEYEFEALDDNLFPINAKILLLPFQNSFYMKLVTTVFHYAYNNDDLLAYSFESAIVEDGYIVDSQQME